MPKKLLVASPKKISGTTKMIIEEAKKLFSVSYTHIHDITLTVSGNKTLIESKGKDLTKTDYFLPKVDGARAYYGYQVVNAFDRYPNVLKPYPAKTINVAHDKFLTTEVLAAKKIPVPATYFVKTKKGIRHIAERAQFPIMIKLMNGSGGMGVMYVEKKDGMSSIIQSMNILKQNVLVQEFIPNKGEDLRILVAGNQIIGAMKRVALPGEKRANIKAGGRGVKYNPTPEIAELSIKCAQAVESKICAVDIVESESGPKVIEVNINPGIRGLTAATETNIAKKLVEYIYSECSR